MRAGGGARAQATARMIIINTISFMLCIDHFYMDWTCVNGDLVFNNFSFVDKVASCFKLYITGYDALHTKEPEMSGFVCLMGCFSHLFAIAYHHIRNYRTWIKTRIFGTIVVISAGVFLLCRGMVILTDDAWSTDAVRAITIGIILIEGVLLIGAQIKKSRGNEQSVRDLVVKLVETTISVIRLVDLIGQAHNPWDGEEILHLVGSSLSVLIGICLICLMVYNVRTLFFSKLIQWRGKIARVFAVDKDVDVHEQAARRCRRC